MLRHVAKFSLRGAPGLGRDEGGSVLVVTALAATALVGFLALATDVALFYAGRQALQNAADAAALGAARAFAAGDQTGWVAEGLGNAAAAGFVNGQNGVAISLAEPPTQGAFQGMAGYVEARASQPMAPIFMQLLMPAGWTPTVSALAVADAGSTGDACVLALDKVQSSDLSVQGTPTLTLSGCGVTVNSASSSALTVGGNGLLSADFVQVVGGISGQNNIQSPDVVTNGAPMADPYAAVPPPAFDASTAKSVTVKDTGVVLSPGVYSSLSFDANSQATLQPGVYVIDGGGLVINGGATVTGSGVTIYLTGSGGTYASVSINGGATVNLSAPTTGPTAGLVMFEDRGAPASTANTLNGGSTTSFTGALYFPNQSVSFSGGNASSGCTQIVADQISFGGNSVLSGQCSGTGTLPISNGPTRLVQ